MRHFPITLDQLRLQLSGLNLFNDDAIAQIEKAIHLIRSTTILIEAEIVRKDFATPEEEIYFFRHIKPPLYSLQIAYCKILKIELLRSSYSKKDFKQFIKQKLDFIKAHYIDFPEFIQYYNLSATHNDERYFLRSNRIELDCFSHFFNDYHSTGYDVVAAYLLAYKFLIDHYDQSDKKVQIEPFTSNTSWTDDKIAFVELISGIQIMDSVNLGKIDLKTLISQLGSVFNIEIKDIYGKRNEIKARKGEKFKYIRQMLDALERDFEENFE